MGWLSFLLALFITVAFLGSTAYGIYRTFKVRRDGKGKGPDPS
ncbi:hypothetical protein [Thermovibrio ammonificans]|uniref:Uncharacterized protein n=1 Tax=Thermovibrio ammonificans (strain DSM 15698 / JCM 12110 / HB-1) TaxID=648996 RepID=E8T3F6_THEA1|nr:hypothetical protein [Thermovibrio ammonificans]ADU97288.1 hypothetical protein Theam_1325 [Thermovibrio ammonificans HB-1]